MRTLAGPMAAALIVAASSACADRESRALAFVASADEYAARGEWRAAAIEYRNALTYQETAGTHFKLATVYDRAGEAEKAVASYIRITQLDAAHVEGHLRASAALVTSQRFAEGGQLAERVLAVEPENVRALVTLAEALDGLGRRTAASTRLQEALTIDPGSAQVHVVRARWALRDGDVAEARAAATRALEREPSADAFTVLGTARWKEGALGEAERNFREAASRSGPDAGDRLLVSFFLGSDQPAKAEPHLQALARRTPRERLALSDYYVLVGRPADAEAVLAPLLVDAPLAGEARLRRAALARAAGRHEEAQSELEAALGVPAVEPRARILQSEWFLAAGNMNDALREVERASALAPQSPEATYALAMVRVARGELAEAEGALRRARSLTRDQGPIDVRLAQLALNRGDMTAALHHAHEAATHAPHAASAAILARTVRVAGDLSRARAILADARGRWPEAEALLLETGYLELAAGRPGAARAAFEQVLHTDAASPGGRSGVLLAHVAAGNPSQARRVLEEWRSQRPDDTAGAILSAQVDAAEGRLPAAEATLVRALAAAPGSAEAREALAQVYIASGKHDQALEEYGQLAIQRPGSAAIHTVVGMLKQDRGDRAGARAAFERAAGLGHDTGVAENNLAWIYADDGRLDEAARMAERAVRSLREAPAALHTLGIVYYRQQRPAEAARHLARAVQARPESSLYRYDFARALVAEGRFAEAASELERVVRGDDAGHAGDARELLQEIRERAH